MGKRIKMICGMTQPGSQLFDGSCEKELTPEKAFRCTDCTAYFHRECALKHFTYKVPRNVKAVEKRSWFIAGKLSALDEILEKLEKGKNAKKIIKEKISEIESDSVYNALKAILDKEKQSDKNSA